MNRLEHVNVTVSDPKKTAAMLIDLFGWHIRWEGSVMDGAGYTIHVGTEEDYVAVYSGPGAPLVPKKDASYITRGGLNHIGVVVDDLDAVEAKVKAMGLTPGMHQDYEPGRRFYFDDPDGIEIEVICYD